MKVVFIPDYRKGNPYQRLLANSLSKEGVEVIFISTFSLLGLFKKLKNNWKPDALHIHWPHKYIMSNNLIFSIIKSILFLIGLLILKFYRVKLIWTVHNLISHESEFKNVELFFTNLLAKLCDKVIVHSESASNEVNKFYKIKKSKIKIIFHGNYIGQYENSISKEKARKILGIDLKNFIFLSFGQIRKYKGLPNLVESFIQLSSIHKFLLIVGKPSSLKIKKYLEKRCARNVNIRFIPEFIKDKKIQIYMNSADVIALPYKSILTSGAIILAMSFKRPIIAPRIGCIKDTLDNEGSFLYDPNKKNGLLEAMEKALNLDKKVVDEMGKHNYRLIKKIKWSDIAKKTYNVYKS